MTVTLTLTSFVETSFHNLRNFELSCRI